MSAGKEESREYITLTANAHLAAHKQGSLTSETSTLERPSMNAINEHVWPHYFQGAGKFSTAGQPDPSQVPGKQKSPESDDEKRRNDPTDEWPMWRPDDSKRKSEDESEDEWSTLP